MTEKPNIGAPTPEKEKPKGRIEVVNEAWGVLLGKSQDGRCYLVYLGGSAGDDYEELWEGFFDLDRFLTVPARSKWVVELSGEDELSQLNEEMKREQLDRFAGSPAIGTYLGSMGVPIKKST